MDTQELIIVTTFCQQYQMDLDFIQDLESVGLIETIDHNEEKYLHINQLVIIEKIIRLHNDLNINKEGVDVILNLLDKINELDKKVKYLKDRLSVYE